MTQVKIYNFYNKFKEPVYANIKGDTITIPQQTLTIESLGGYTISGKGYLNESLYYGENGELIMRYSIQEPSGKTNDYGINIGEPSIWNR